MESYSEAPHWCPVCRATGKEGLLESFHINFEESVYMCTNLECTYPIGVENIDSILNGPNCLANLKLGTSASVPPDILPTASTASHHLSTVSNICDPISTSEVIPDLTKQETSICSIELSLDANLSSDFADKTLPDVGSDFLDELFGTSTNFDLSDLQNDSSHSESVAAVSSDHLSKDNTGEITEASTIDPVIENEGDNRETESNLDTESCPADIITSSVKSPIDVAKPVNTNKLESSAINPVSAAAETKTLPFSSVIDIPKNTAVANEGALYPQWKNQDAFCWLDVSLVMLTHSIFLSRLIDQLPASNLIYKLIKTYDYARTLINKVGKSISLETSIGKVHVKTGGGQSPLKHCLTSLIGTAEPLVIKPDSVYQAKAEDALHTIREQVWNYLQPKMKIERGSHDSPVFALPLLLGDKGLLQRHFSVAYTWKMVCCHCGHIHEDWVEKVMPTFPNVPSDFSMCAPCFIRSCFKCEAKRQRMNMIFDRLPPVIFQHFVEGIPTMPFSELDFSYKGAPYRVTGVVQYHDNHFICWLRHHTEEKWRRCDDLDGANTQFSTNDPDFPGNQVHIIMWEVAECEHNHLLKEPSQASAKKKVQTLPVEDAILLSPEPQVKAKPKLQTKPPSVAPKSNEISTATKPQPVAFGKLDQNWLGDIVLPSITPGVSSGVITTNHNITTSKLGNMLSNQTLGVTNQSIKQLLGSKFLAHKTVSGSTKLMQAPKTSLTPQAGAWPLNGISCMQNYMPIMTPLVQNSRNPLPHQPQPAKTAARHSEDRLAKVRERLEVLRAKNAAKKAGKVLPTYASPQVSAPNIKPSAQPPKTVAKHQSYLDAVRPYLQHKLGTNAGLASSYTPTQKFSGYLTKAEKTRQEELAKKAKLLLEEAQRNERQKQPTAKLENSVPEKKVILSSPKKSVRFTPEVNSQPQRGVKRASNEGLPDEPQAKVACSSVRTFNSQIGNNIKSKLDSIIGTCQNAAPKLNGNGQASHNMMQGNQNMKQKQNEVKADNMKKSAQRSQPTEDKPKTEHDNCLVDELLKVVFSDDNTKDSIKSANDTNIQSNIVAAADIKDCATNDLALNTNLCDSYPDFGDADMLSMPMFF